MSCIVQQGEKKIVHDHQSCVLCRDKPANYVPLTPGEVYPKCSLVINGETKLDPKLPLTDLAAQCDLIYGVVTCTEDLSEETAETLDGCKFAVLTTGRFDPNYICWPEGTPAEVIDAYTCSSACCLTFSKRYHCTPVPEEYAAQLDKAKAEKVKTEAQEKAAPVQRQSQRKKTGQAA